MDQENPPKEEKTVTATVRMTPGAQEFLSEITDRFVQMVMAGAMTYQARWGSGPIAPLALKSSLEDVLAPGWEMDTQVDEEEEIASDP